MTGKTLFITVGTGDVENLQSTLLEPLKKSILQGEWAEVVLLPSQETASSAKLVCEDMHGLPLVIEPLPKPGQENDADKTYAHFEAVIARRIHAGVQPGQMLADFTRGTKAMSAALVLAAARHEIPRLRYIVGQRNQRGSVKAGTEKIHEFRTTASSGHRLLDQARLIMKNGNFAAALDILPVVQGPMANLWPKDVQTVSAFARACAEFYSAWDRLDYVAAQSLLDSKIPQCLTPEWTEFAPGKDIERHIRLLAAPQPKDNKECAPWLRIKAIDLLANGERRIQRSQFEDAYLRAYRVLELVGQASLFGHGLDSAQIPKDHVAVMALQARLEKKREHGFGLDRKTGNYTAPRELTARLLKELGDPIGVRLIDLAKGGLTSARNTSLLIHGFTATSYANDKNLPQIYADLEQLLLDEYSDAAPALEVARRVNFK